MERTVSMPSIFITEMRKFDMNRGPGSDKIRSGGPYGDTHASMTADATDMAVIRRKATHLVSLTKRLVITRLKRLPLFEACMGRELSTESSVSGTVAGTRVRRVLYRRKERRSRVHVIHLVIVYGCALPLMANNVPDAWCNTFRSYQDGRPRLRGARGSRRVRVASSG